MVQRPVYFIIRRGLTLKARISLAYMAAIRLGHIVRYLDGLSLSKSVVNAALKGLKNMESLENEAPRKVMAVDLLKKVREKLKTMMMSGLRRSTQPRCYVEATSRISRWKHKVRK